MLRPFAQLAERLATIGIRSEHRWATAVEMVGVSALFLAVGALFVPNDPLGLRAPFPWGWFGPALLALHHGTLAALGSVLLLGLGHALIAPLPLNDQWLQYHLIGGLVLLLVLGQFSDLWRSRMRREQERSEFSQEQLRTLTRDHYLLRRSHERLEQELLLRSGSLREAMGALSDALHRTPDSTGLPQADTLIDILAEYCRLESASLHLVGPGGAVHDAPVATIGNPPPLIADDPLLVEALSESVLTHVARARVQSRYLVAAPVTTTSGTRGVLLVSDLPFTALDPENLQTLNLLLLDYAEQLERERHVAPLIAKVPLCPPAFAWTLCRLWQIRRRTGILSHGLTLLASPDDSRSRALLRQLSNQRRALDTYWLEDEDDHGPSRLHVLLPLGSRSMIDGLVERYASVCRETHGAESLAESGLNVLIRSIDRPPADLLGLYLEPARR